MELSTPFVSIRGVLSRIGMKASKLYVVNGMLMLVTFFFCRIVMFPYVCYLHAQALNMKLFDVRTRKITTTFGLTIVGFRL